MTHPLETGEQSVPADARLSTQQLSILIFGLLAHGIGQAIIFAILPPLGREVGLGEIAITSMISASALIFTIASPWWGRLSDRTGRKPLILLGLTGYSVGTLCFALVFWWGLNESVPYLFLWALLVRCCQSLIMSASGPATVAYAADHTSRQHRMPTLAKLGTANSIAMILGPILVSVASIGLLVPLYTAALLAALAALTIWLFLPPDRQHPSQRPAVKKLKLSDSRLRVYLLCGIGIYSAFGSVQQTMAFRVQDMLLLGPEATAQYTGLSFVPSAICMLLMQLTVVQRFRGPPLQLVAGGALFMCLGSIAIGFSTSLWSLVPALALMGTGFGLTAPAISSGASLAVNYDEQGGAAGLVAAGPAVGFIVGPVVGGALYQWHPEMGATLAAVVVLIVGIYALRQAPKTVLQS